MDLLWPVITVCLGLAGNCEPATYYAEQMPRYECPTRTGVCLEARPAGARPLPGSVALPEGVARASAEPLPPVLPPASPPPAQEQLSKNCAPTATIEQDLATKWGEAKTWIGLADSGGAVIQLWQNPETQTWSLFASGPKGTSCMIVSGKQMWQTPLGSPVSLKF